MNQTDEKGLLPEKEYDAFNPELAEQRRKASELTLKFNTSGDISFLEELFDRKLDNVKISAPFHCNYGGDNIQFGKNVFINFNCTFQPAGGVEFGDDVFVGSDVRFYTTIHPLDPEERTSGKASVRPIKIGSKVWIGGGAIILPGVEIGEGTTIGGGSVVTRSIPPRSVAVGNPCKVIRTLGKNNIER